MGKRGDLLSGTWQSSWGSASIKVDAGKMTGTWAEGSLTGTVGDDGKVAMDWSHEDGTTGKATLMASEAEDALTGTWGFAGSDTDGGDWSLSQTKREAPEPEPEPAPEPKAEEPKPAAKAADAKPAAKGKKGKK